MTGSSNIAKGVTIDLRGMRNVSLNKKTKTATIQPGAKWVEVYDHLRPLGYAVPGGRAGTVGVGGLVSGGMYFDAVAVAVMLCRHADFLRRQFFFCWALWFRMRQRKELRGW